MRGSFFAFDNLRIKPMRNVSKPFEYATSRRRRFVDFFNGQLGLALFLLFTLVGMTWKFLDSQTSQLASLQEELKPIQLRLSSERLQTIQLSVMEPNFTERWPKRNEIDSQLNYLNRLARTLRVSVGQMTFMHVADDGQTTGRVDISLNLSGSYISTKQLLAELLGRYPTLVVQSLSVVPRSGDVSGTDWKLRLTLFVKDR